jgi:hypothetical protein
MDSCTAQGAGAAAVAGHVPQSLLAGRLDTERLRFAFKPALQAEGHEFQRASQVAEPLQAIRVTCQKLLRAKRPPLDHVNQLMRNPHRFPANLRGAADRGFRVAQQVPREIDFRCL